MPLLAVLNSRARLEELIAAGEGIGAVATHTTEVVEGARAHGLPCVHSDDLSTVEEQIAESAHVHRLGTALAGDEVPAPEDVQHLMWWAIEHHLKSVLAGGYRTRRLVAAGLDLFDGASGIVHDAEGLMQGGVTALAAHALGLPVVGLPPGVVVAMHRPQDVAVCPVVGEGVRTEWRGEPTPEDGRRTVAVISTNEIVHLLRPLIRGGERWLSFAMDAGDPWRGWEGTDLRPAALLDARPVEGAPTAPIVEPVWPLAPEFPCLPWEREVAELLFVTFQPFVREEVAWATAAYSAGRVVTWFGGSDLIAHIRARVAACRALGIPTVLIQHGAIGDLRLRIHHFADESAMWSRTAAKDLRAAGCRRPLHVVGWPQAALQLGKGRRPRRTVEVPDGWVVLTTSPGDTEGDSYRAGEVFLRDALRAIREVDPRAPIFVKIHPFEHLDTVRAFCTAHGFPEVTIVEGVDSWGLLPGMTMVVAAPSTAVLSAVRLGVPVVLYHPWPVPTFYGRFREVPVARTYGELIYGLRRKLNSSGTDSVADYGRADTDVVRRVLAILRRTTGRGLAVPNSTA